MRESVDVFCKCHNDLKKAPKNQSIMKMKRLRSEVYKNLEIHLKLAPHICILSENSRIPNVIYTLGGSCIN